MKKACCNEQAFYNLDNSARELRSVSPIAWNPDLLPTVRGLPPFPMIGYPHPVFSIRRPIIIIGWVIRVDVPRRRGPPSC